METKPNDCAMPITQDVIYDNAGLTKREYFAAVAPQGLLSASVGGRIQKADFEHFSKQAFQFADGMIEELNKNPESAP